MKKFFNIILIFICLGLCCNAYSKNTKSLKGKSGMFNPNNFGGTDSARINSAVAAASAAGINQVTITERQNPDGRKYWLIDEAITLPANMEIVIDNCKIKLSDNCRDNFFRSANCGIGIKKIKPLENIRITGRGNAILEGAEHPRATGDSGKILNDITYGTDADKPNENPKGDWRNIGILLAYVNNFAISGITLRNYHAWGISLEYCSYGKLTDIKFDTAEYRVIDGKIRRILNQDGIDLRRGCHHIDIENISGTTGDDIVALTALKSSKKTTGVAAGTEISVNEKDIEKNHVHDITIRNISGASNRNFIRLLNNFGIKIYNITIENVKIDIAKLATGNEMTGASIRIGDANPNWGGVTPLGDIYNVTVKNIESNAPEAVYIAGSLMDSTISDVTNYNKKCAAIEYASGPQNVKNVKISNVKTVSK